MKCNYHTHTTRCKHAFGEDEAFVQAAITAGFDELGFADHAPWPYRSDFVSHIRMSMDQLPDYVASIRSLREKYAGQIQLHIGLECEYFPSYADNLRRLLDSGVEYLILGAHFNDTDETNPYVAPPCKEDDVVKRYTENCIVAMETGMFRYIAHPDLFMSQRSEDEFNSVCQDAARDIALCAKAHHMPLEYNLMGLLMQLEGPWRGYPSNSFWQYVRPYAGDVLLGVDAHRPEHLTHPRTWDEGMKRLKSFGYTPLDFLF